MLEVGEGEEAAADDEGKVVKLVAVLAMKLKKAKLGSGKWYRPRQVSVEKENAEDPNSFYVFRYYKPGTAALGIVVLDPELVQVIRYVINKMNGFNILTFYKISFEALFVVYNECYV